MSELSYYDWRAPMRALILKENYNLALVFPVSVRKEMVFELFFFRVARAHPIERVYTLPEMAPGELRDFTYLGEGGLGAGDDVFAMSEERPFRVLHFGIGVWPRNLKVWKQQPAGFTATGWSRKVPTRAGDPVDYFDGNLSPFEEPTRVSETLVWLKGSLYLAFRNDEPVAVMPRLRILGAGYDLWPVVDKALADRMVKGAIPCRFISVGGLAELQYTIPDEWKGKSFRYGVGEIASILRGA